LGFDGRGSRGWKRRRCGGKETGEGRLRGRSKAAAGPKGTGVWGDRPRDRAEATLRGTGEERSREVEGQGRWRVGDSAWRRRGLGDGGGSDGCTVCGEGGERSVGQRPHGYHR
ncbi:hypothetical protein KI387_035990, partial [Taxus chinensis]